MNGSEDGPTKNTITNDLLFRINHAKDFACLGPRLHRIDMEVKVLAQAWEEGFQCDL